MRDDSVTKIETKILSYTEEILSVSVGGLPIHLISLTHKQSPIPLAKRKCIYLVARQHSAETPGSHIMRFILKELTENSKQYE